MIYDYYYRLKDYLLSRIWRKAANDSSIKGIVLMYHHISDEYVNINLSCRCSIKVFEHYLDYYKEKGFDFLSIDEAYKRIIEKKQTESLLNPFCVVTFDDIPDDVFINAYKLLKERCIPFTVFITTKYLDQIESSTNRKFITKEHLDELCSDSLCTIGAHTESHPNLRRAKNSKEEMKKNKEWLESLVGHSVDYIAYPYGKHSSVSKKIQREARQIGFKCAFGTIDAPITDLSSKKLFFLPRIVNN